MTGSGVLDCFHPALLMAIRSHWDSSARDLVQRDFQDYESNLGALLHYAVLHDNATIVKYLTVDMKCEVDILDENCRTPLMVALENEYVKCIEALLEANADIYFINQHGVNIIKMALASESLDRKVIMHFLVRMRVDFPFNDKALVDILINAECSMYHASFFEDRKLLEDLLEHGVDINSPGRSHMDWTALHEAAAVGDVNLAKWLLQNRANVDVLDDNGNSPLHIAAAHGEVDIMRLLLEYGADPNIVDKEYDCTPLLVVFINPYNDEDQTKFDQCIELLLKYNAIPRNSNMDNLTLFDYAALKQQSLRINRLVGHLAMLDKRNGNSNLADTIMYFNHDEHAILQSNLVKNYELCKSFLEMNIYRKLSVFVLLTEREDKLRTYVRDKTFVSAFYDLESRMRVTFPFYLEPLLLRINAALDAVELENDAIPILCEIIGCNYNKGYIIARKVTSQLSVSELLQLTRVQEIREFDCG